jgi:mannitol/fructose-specific phosphotransferase system IIA component (Ntr-type)
VSGFEFIVPGASRPHLKARTKEEAVRAIVAGLASAGAIPDSQREPIARAVLVREELATTGVGHGIAIPHAKHPAVPRPIAALGYSADGVDFQSLDGQPVHLIVLLVSPQGQSRAHLLALEAVSRRLTQRGYEQWRSPRRHAGE